MKIVETGSIRSGCVVIKALYWQMLFRKHGVVLKVQLMYVRRLSISSCGMRYYGLSREEIKRVSE